MDEKPKCSHTVDIAPIKQQPTEKDQSESKSKDLRILPEELTSATKTQTLLILPEEPTPAAKTLLILPDEPTPAAKTLLILPEELTPAAKTQTLLILPEEPTPAAKTLLILPEELTPAAKTQTLLILPEEPTPAVKTLLILPEELTPAAKTQTVLLKELPTSSEVKKTQPTFTIDQPFYLMEQNEFSKDQPGFSGDQPAFSKNQPAFSEDQPSHSKDQPDIAQPTFSKTQTVDEPALTASLTKIYIDLTKDESATSSEFIVEPKIQIDKSEDESSLTKEQKTLIFTKHSTAAAALSSNINKDHFISTNAPLKITSSTQSPTINKSYSQMPASETLTFPPIGTPSQPLSLFLQALSKLNESSLALAVLPFRLQSSPNLSKICNVVSGDITPPDSLTSAPPTYSFVLRQMAIRRRPRFMGTFFPSPSFVQHAPPPTYTGAFDVYIEPSLPPPPARVYNFGFTSMAVVCSECGFTGMTLTKSRVTICTHLCAITLCLLCCWICAPLPYILSSCKDVYHYCRNCRTFLGMYCPTNPEAAYPNV